MCRTSRDGTKLKEHLSDSVFSKFVVVEFNKRDRNEWILGKAPQDGEDLNPEEIKASLALQEVSGEADP